VLATGRDRTRGALLTEAGIAFRPAELSDRRAIDDLCAGAATVVHCAALSSPWGPKQAFVRSNIEATDALIAACQRSRVARLVHISTPSLYMGARDFSLARPSARFDREGVREDDPLGHPVNHYASTKLECERRVRAALARGLPSIILRPRAIFGPGDTTIFPRVLRALETGRLPVIGNGQNRVDLTYIDNAVQAIVCALDAPSVAWGQTYNITNGEPVLLWEVLRWLCAELKLPAPRGSLPVGLGMLLGGALELFHHVARPHVEPKLTRYSVQVLGCTMTLDIRRAREQLGYAPAVSMQEGLARFVAWWVEQNREQVCRE